MNVIGIKRAVKHSPNHINNDATIFAMVVSGLEAAGIVVNTYHEHEFLKVAGSAGSRADLIFSMSRNPEVLAALKTLQAAGPVKIINAPKGIEKCFRSNITRLLLENQIPTADSAIIKTARFEQSAFDNLDSGHGFWLKRGDFHAIQKEDVVFAADSTRAKELLAAFHFRGIQEVVLSEHLKGDLIKFYGVAGTDFFHWLYPFDKDHYKYKEFKAINGATHYFDFDVRTLAEVAGKIAQIADVPIYGGDAVIDKDGGLAIIDFNDWPSFAPCREKAAESIAAFLLAAIQNHQKVHSNTLH